MDTVSCDVFISYAHGDAAIAEAACLALERKGLTCWIAPRDVTPGREWGQAIIEALSGAKAMVLIFSSRSSHSVQVRKEILAAVERDCMIIPFRIENVMPEGSLKLHLSGVHWLDAFPPPPEQHLERLADTVGAIVRNQRLTPSPRPGFDRPKPHRRAAVAVLIVLLAGLVSGGTYAWLHPNWFMASRPEPPLPRAVAQTPAPPTSPAPMSAPLATTPIVAPNGWIGLSTAPIGVQIAKDLHLERSDLPMVSDYLPGGPAQKAGLKFGDIIASVDNSVVSSFDMARKIELFPVGSTVEFRDLREGYVTAHAIQIGARPTTDAAGFMASRRATMNSGDPADPKILEAYGVLSAPIPDDAKNHADELTDFGIAPNPTSRPVKVNSDTPLVLPGAARTSTDQVKAALKLAPNLLIVDARPCKDKDDSIAGAYCAQTSDEKPFVDQVGVLTSRHYATPLLVLCAGATCWESYIAATYLVQAGYTRIIWYRGGAAAWADARNELKLPRPMPQPSNP